MTNVTNLVLNVVESFSGLTWRSSFVNSKLAANVSKNHNLPEFISHMLATRGIDEADIPEFLDPSIKNTLPDPSCFADMDLAVARIAEAIGQKQYIAVFGDYDVDGASASALLLRYLNDINHDKVRLYIPDRLNEGYGPNSDAIRQLINDNVDLIITVDCGTTSFEPLAVAAAAGLDVVVIDHHQTSTKLPAAAAIVNPNRKDDLSYHGHLAGVGVAFMVLVALNRHLRQQGRDALPDLLQLLDLVALGTVCDLVPLIGINRAFVNKGLKVMAMRHNKGLTALADVARLTKAPDAKSLGFMIGPRINAAGRIGNPELACKLLCTDDNSQAIAIAQKLDALNKQRQQMERDMLISAEAMLPEYNGDDDPALITLANADWHQGLVGLIASRLSRRLNRPAVIGAINNDKITASARSIAGADIAAAITNAVSAGLALKGGGHAMAAGVEVALDNWPAFSDFINQELTTSIIKARKNKYLNVDGCLSLAAVNVELAELIAKAGPYGPGNAEPLIAFAGQKIKYAKLIGQAHLQLTLSDGNNKMAAIAFNVARTKLGHALNEAYKRGTSLHIAATASVNRWNNKCQPQLIVADAAPAHL